MPPDRMGKQFRDDITRMDTFSHIEESFVIWHLVLPVRTEKKYIKPKFKQKKQQKKDVKCEKVLPWLPCGYKINYILRSHVYQDCISILYAVFSLILKADSVRRLKNLILRKELMCDANETLKTLSERPSPNSRRGCVDENLTLI